MINYLHSDLTALIIKQAYYVHNVLGFGFLEKVYENALSKKLRDSGLSVKQQQSIKVVFEEEVVGDFAADILVNDTVIIELKAIDALNSQHEVQLVNYLRATGIEVGLLINFGKSCHIKRKVQSKDF